jgi:hypothetical protein
MPKPQRRNPLATAQPVATVSETTIELPIGQIDRTGGTQIRLQLNQKKVDEYAELIEEGVITLHGTVNYDGTTYWLKDGFHRFSGLEQLRRTHARVEVQAGTRRDAVLYAATEANNRHGLPLTPEDKRNAALTLLRDKEWRQWGDRLIARKVGITHPTVGKLRRQVEEEERTRSGKNYQMPTERKVMRAGVEYTMQTETINRAREIRTTAAAWLQQQASGEANRRHLLQQLLDNSGSDNFLWRGLLSTIALETDREEVTPILRSLLAEMEESATVDGTEYRQARIEEPPAAAAPPPAREQGRASGPAYAEIWQLEAALRSWLERSQAASAHLEIVQGLRDDERSWAEIWDGYTWRKRDSLQAIANVAEQCRQAAAFQWLKAYRDDRGRSWRDLEDNQVHHANSPCYQAFIRQYPAIADPKFALKQALAQLRREHPEAAQDERDLHNRTDDHGQPDSVTPAAAATDGTTVQPSPACPTCGKPQYWDGECSLTWRCIPCEHEALSASQRPAANSQLLTASHRANARQLRQAAQTAFDALGSYPSKDAARLLGQPFQQLHADLLLKAKALRTLLDDQYGEKQ